MRAHLRTATPYLLGILLVCLVLWLLESSQLFHSCVSEGENPAREEAPQDKISVFVSEFWIYRRCLGVYVIERNAGITALFTVVLAVSTILLWIVTRTAAEAAKIAADHIPRVERAYLFMVVNGETIRHPIMAAYAAANSTNQDEIIETPLDIEFSFENQGELLQSFAK
jgi:hypothetical protein